MPGLDRRELLLGAGALAAGAGRIRPGRAAGTVFTSGVASFDPTATAVLLWTRAVPPSGGDVALRWVVATDEALSDVVAHGEVQAPAATDHCVAVDATGLEPGRTWWYSFEADDGTPSPTGRTRTAVAGPVERLRVGVASCSRYASGGFAAYAALSQHELDLVVHLGDYIYEDGQAGVRRHEPPQRLVTVEQYRARYGQHRSDPHLQALHARHPMVAVWDDHELAGNAWEGGARDHDEAAAGPWPARLHAATTARQEWVPARSRVDEAGRTEWWRHLPLADDVELVVLDTRSRRDRQPTVDELAADLSGPARAPRSMLGERQAAFVAERLARRDRPRWVLVANQVMLHPLHLPVPDDDLVEDLAAAGFPVVDGDAVNPDQWDGYPGARDELLDQVGTRGGVVVLTGDVHSSWAWSGAGRDADAPPLVELVTPSVSAEPLSTRLPLPGVAFEVGATTLFTDLAHVDVDRNGYVLVELGPDQVHAEWWTVEPDEPGSQRFAKALDAPRATPMRLTDSAERVEPTSATPPTTVPATEEEGGGIPTPALGGAAAATVAAVAAAVAVRRRRT